MLLAAQAYLQTGDAQRAEALFSRAAEAERTAHAEDAAELKGLLVDLRSAVDSRSEPDIRRIAAEVEDLVFYLNEG